MQIPTLQPHLTGLNGIEGRDLQVRHTDSSGKLTRCVGLLATFQSNELAMSVRFKRICQLWRCTCNTASTCRSEAAAKLLGTAGVPGLQLRSWGEQATHITANLVQERHCSVATQLEVRLREALEQCNTAAAAHLTDESLRGPHKMRTAVCCHVLRELASLAGPFSGVLRTLSHELVLPQLLSKLPDAMCRHPKRHLVLHST